MVNGTWNNSTAATAACNCTRLTQPFIFLDRRFIIIIEIIYMRKSHRRFTIGLRWGARCMHLNINNNIYVPRSRSSRQLFAINANWRFWSLIHVVQPLPHAVTENGFCRFAFGTTRYSREYERLARMITLVASDVSFAALRCWCKCLLPRTQNTFHAIHGNRRREQCTTNIEQLRCHSQPHKSKMICCITWDLCIFITFYPEIEVNIAFWGGSVHTMDLCETARLPYPKRSRVWLTIADRGGNRFWLEKRAEINDFQWNRVRCVRAGWRLRKYFSGCYRSTSLKWHWRQPISFFLVQY